MKTNKIIRLNCLSVQCSLILACFFEGVVCDICGRGVFEHWSKLATKSFKKVSQSGQWCPSRQFRVIDSNSKYAL